MNSTEKPLGSDVEQSLIGCLLNDANVALEACECITAAHFADYRYQWAFEAIQTLIREDKPIGLPSLYAAWSKAHDNSLPNELLMAPDAAPSAFNAAYYVEIMVEAHRRRTVKTTAFELYEACKDASKTVDELVVKAESMLSVAEVNQPSIIGPKEAWVSFQNDLERRHALNGKLSGISTGFYDLDKITEGLQAGEMFVIGARPSQGKTAIGTAFAIHACLKGGVPTLFVSLEMSETSILRRMVSAYGNIDIADLRSGRIDKTEASKCVEVAKAIAKSPFYFVDGVDGLNSLQFSSVVSRAVRKHGIRLVIVDYLQKLKPCTHQEKRTYEIKETSNMCRSVAHKHGICVVTLAQLNRESDRDQRTPRMSDLADSKEIEADADVIALLSRDKKDTEKAILCVVKQRDGELGMANLRFNKRFARFESLASERCQE